MILLFSSFADNFIYTGLEVSMMIGERLQEIRKDNGDTQQDLANKLHASLYAVRCWEQGKSDPSHDTLAAICRLYDVCADRHRHPRKIRRGSPLRAAQAKPADS